MYEELVCFFCGEVGKSVFKSSQRVHSIREASKKRGDNLHNKLDDDTNVVSHKLCLNLLQ